MRDARVLTEGTRRTNVRQSETEVPAPSSPYGQRMKKQYGEWSMGNGQCPICYGAGPTFFPHPLHLTAASIGHELDCPAPTKTIMKGQYAPVMTPELKTHLARVRKFDDSLRELVERTWLKHSRTREGLL
jgi:hypothetical protein